MPPRIALLLCVAFIGWLLARDIKNNPGVSRALWIPLAWMVIIGSRLPSEWLTGSATSMSTADAYLEGSPVDRNVYLFLIVIGIIIILSRSVSWQAMFANNAIISVFLVYTLISISWSDFPVTAIKRWNKVIGHVIMALVVFTEREPERAFGALFRRCAYILIPLSVLFIKYYPELGRGFDIWTGVAFNVGVTTNKNTLGNLCMVVFLFFLASVFVTSQGKQVVTKLDRYIYILFLYLIGWLLSLAHSASSLASTVMGGVIIVGAQAGAIRRHLTALLVVVAIVGGLLQTFGDLKDTVIAGLGRDTTLTGRTELWEDLKKVEINPLVGAGFESFWLGDRIDRLWRKYWWHPNQAHNGYFEMYLNLGLIGLCLHLGMIVSSYLKARRQMLFAAAPGETTRTAANGQAQFRLAFVLAIVAFNLTDATFKATHLSFFVFFMVALEYHAAQEPVTAVLEMTRQDGTAARTSPFAPTIGIAQRPSSAAAGRGRPSKWRYQPKDAKLPAPKI